MKKILKIALIIIGVISLLLIIDLIFIFTTNQPLFAIKSSEQNSYKGLFYDVYNCPEYSVPQIKAKGSKFSCSTAKTELGKVIDIVDKTKEMKNFSCAEALESFYEDENNQYFYNCIKGKYMIVRYENGYEETIENALKNGTIKISDLDKYNIDYIKYKK